MIGRRTELGGLHVQVLHEFARGHERSFAASDPPFPIYPGQKCMLVITNLPTSLPVELESGQPELLEVASLGGAHFQLTNSLKTRTQAYILVHCEAADLGNVPPSQLPKAVWPHPSKESRRVLGRIWFVVRSERTKYNNQMVLPEDPIERLPGVGRALGVRLRQVGIHAVQDLSNHANSSHLLLDHIHKGLQQGKERSVSRAKLDKIVARAVELCRTHAVGEGVDPPLGSWPLQLPPLPMPLHPPPSSATASPQAGRGKGKKQKGKGKGKGKEEEEENEEGKGAEKEKEEGKEAEKKEDDPNAAEPPKQTPSTAALVPLGTHPLLPLSSPLSVQAPSPRHLAPLGAGLARSQVTPPYGCAIAFPMPSLHDHFNALRGFVPGQLPRTPKFPTPGLSLKALEEVRRLWHSRCGGTRNDPSLPDLAAPPAVSLHHHDARLPVDRPQGALVQEKGENEQKEGKAEQGNQEEDKEKMDEEDDEKEDEDKPPAIVCWPSKRKEPVRTNHCTDQPC